MDVSDIILAFINAVTLIIVARLETTEKRAKRLSDERYSIRCKNEQYSARLWKEVCKLSVLTAKKQSGEHINGELEEAVHKAEDAYSSYDQFVEEEMSKHLNSRN